jgi:NAD(P)-dependent dehydrogenase (short-subunit alcohol dehydrogenase family)/acyl carrier protein
VALRDRGTYVITGGVGGIGLVLARHIAGKTRSRIVLISRTPLPPEAEWPSLMASSGIPEDVKEKIRGIQAVIDAGGQPVAMQADVSDAVAMKNVMAEIRNRYGAVHGIIHAAGVAGSGMIQMKTKQEAHSILSPKVQGTEWLREQLGAADLDFIMLCSSISAILPYFGLSDYAAANAYLDGFAAAHDDPAGTRVLSVNWDTWREVGMAVHAEVPAALAHLREDRLKHAILPEEGAEVFDRILALGVTQFLVSTRDVAALQRLEAAAVANAAPALSSQLNEDGSRLESKEELLPGAEEEIEGFIIALWRELLGVSTVALNDNFFQLGGHSLMGTQVLSRVRERFRINLPLRSVFEAATPAELAERIRVMRWAVSPGVTSAEVEREEIEI